jgi:hypothetical protein
MKRTIFIMMSIFFLSGCSQNYSNGERIGLITKFSRSGIIWKSWEGHLNLTQTGMNSAQPFDFSIDNDNEPENLVKTLDSAAQYGWKVKLVYHQVFGYNWFNNRGDTDYFVTKCEVLDKNVGSMFSGSHAGRVVDTIYVVVVDSSRLK